MERCLKQGIATVEPTEEAERNWVDLIVRSGESRRRFIESCTPGYYNNEGRLSDVEARSAPFAGGPIAFVRLLREWRSKGDFAGLECGRAA